MEWRRRFYIDPQLQFPLIVGLSVVAALQGLLLGWGLYKLISIATQWDRPNQVTDFFLVFLVTVVPVVLTSFACGAYISHRIAGPVQQLRKAIAEITRGNLEVEAHIRRNDLLQDCVGDFNRMVQTLRRLLYRDHGYTGEVNKLLSEMQEALALDSLPDERRKKLQKLFVDCKSRLSIINAHFMKGKKESL